MNALVRHSSSCYRVGFRFSLLLLCACICSVQLAATAEGGPAANPATDKTKTGTDGDKGKEESGATDQVDSMVKTVGYSFNPPPLDIRRDVFYDIIEVEEAILKAQEIEKKKGEDGGDVPPVTETDSLRDSESLEEVIKKANNILSDIRHRFLAGQWQQVIKMCDTSLGELDEFIQKYPDSERLKQIRVLIRNNKVQAVEKLRYEQAKAEFDALGIIVEGILWSADGNSLAIINEEEKALAVNDKVRTNAAVIIRIDSNRVDFMVVKDAYTYHFQRYIGDESE